MKYRVIVHLIREHEKDAKDAFLKHQIGKHKHLKLRDVGFSIKKDIPYIGDRVLLLWVMAVLLSRNFTNITHRFKPKGSLEM